MIPSASLDADLSSLIPASFSKYHHPYFTPGEVERLSEKQRGKLSVTQEEKQRQQACGFIESIGAKIGFPRKTIATAQNLYHRFHLFFPRKDFSYYDVTLAALYVSTKMHDTLKKPRELLMVSYAIRFPELSAKSRSLGGELDMDQNTVEQDRQRLLAVERLILEMICFNFTSRLPFPYVIKIGKAFRVTKKLTKLAWRLVIDSHRTPVSLEYPPHEVAIGCLYLAALLTSFEQAPSAERPDTLNSHQIADILGRHGDWETKYQVHVEDIEDIAHSVIDLLIQACQNPSANTSAATSPSTPQSPLPHPSPRGSGAQNPSAQITQPSVPYKVDQLIRLKIHMRESEHQPRKRIAVIDEDPSEVVNGGMALLGKNEGTVRFLFGPGCA